MYQSKTGKDMDKTNLKKRGHSWYARLVIPPSMRASAGKSELVRALGTRDLREANRLKHRVLTELQQELSRIVAHASLPLDSAEYVLATAKQFRAQVLSGEAREKDAEIALDVALEEHLELAAKKYGRSRAGHPLVPEAHERTLKLAHKVFHSGDVALLSESIKQYLEETRKRVTVKGIEEKERHLQELADWLKGDCDVSTITKKIAGRYTAEILLRKGHAPKTTRDILSNLGAFWTWLEGRGLVEFNPWHGMSRTVKSSTRGTKPKRRPWTNAELKKLLEGIPNGDPLLPMAMLAAYTGMRREEVAMLRAEDVHEDDALGVTEGKTRAALRRVPIHPAIKSLVARLKGNTHDGYLIPGLLTGGPDEKRSHYVGKRFTEIRKGLGITDEALNFHTLRNAFMQRCEDAEVPESTVKLLVGHSRANEMTYGRYSPGPKFEVMRKALLKVTYGEVDALVRRLGKQAEVTKKSRRRQTATKAKLSERAK